MKCIFCDISSQRAPASVVIEEERCVAFLDIRPVNPGHTLVIPRRHAASLAELDPLDGAAMFQTARRLALALRASGLRCEGINFYLADGEAAGQEVFHVHLHVIPRYAGDGFRLRFGPGYGQVPLRSELDDLAGQIRAVMPPG